MTWFKKSASGSIIVVILLILTVSGFHVSRPSLPIVSPEPIAVIELFSSQGCSSCPAADELLGKTISEAANGKKNIFALSFHVDYWDRLGWKDPFSNKKFSERQNLYTDKLKLRSNYTPQMVVNGNTEFVGSDKKALTVALNSALKTASEVTFIALQLSLNDKREPMVHYALKGNFGACEINFALLSLAEKTEIKRGENSGRTLINNHVVYQFYSKDAIEKGEFTFSISPLPAKEKTLLIAYIQDTNSLKITGAAEARL